LSSDKIIIFAIFFEENYYTKQGKLLNKKAPAMVYGYLAASENP